MHDSTIAVITGDLINSSKYPLEVSNGVRDILNNLFEKYKLKNGEDVYFSTYRGDSFQGVVKEPADALHICLEIKTAITGLRKATHAPNASPLADVRISIGIGGADILNKPLAESNGEAFQFSGKILDGMKASGAKFALTTAHSDINEEFKVHLKFLDAITNRWSIASAEVVHYLLQNLKEKDIANQLNISQAAINYRKKAAGWEEIELLLQRYQQVVKKYFK